MSEQEVPISKELLEKVLSGITQDAVLIGGQALAVWVTEYNIDITSSSLSGSISNDADFLGDRKDVAAIAKSVSGKSKYPTERQITALVGQVEINVSKTEFVNIDVLHKVIGIDAASIKRRATEVHFGSTKFYLMHPLDVLQSRVENLSQLDSKRNEVGIEQARLAALVAHEYIVSVSKNPDDEGVALKAIEHVASIAKSAAGRHASRQFGISFFSAIPRLHIKNEMFQEIRWPRLYVELNKASGINDTGLINISNGSELVKFLLDNNLQVQHLNTSSKTYTGKILWADEFQAAQSLGKGRVVIHNISDWPTKLEVNNDLRTIQYKDRVPLLTTLPSIDQGSSLSR